MSKHIAMHSGRVLDVEQLAVHYIDLEDIIWHHSHHPRWNSALQTPVSVGEHVLFCDDLFCWEIEQAGGDMDDDRALRISKARLDLLIHDAAEAYTADIPTGIKSLEIRELQRRIGLVIRAALGLDWEADTDWVRGYDSRSLVAEARSYAHPHAYFWIRKNQLPDVEVPAFPPTLYGAEACAIELRTRLNECLEVVRGGKGKEEDTA